MKQHLGKAPITWVLVADAKTAQIYTPKLVEHQIPLAVNGKHLHAKEKPVWELMPILAKQLEAESANNYEISRKQNGKVFESFSTARHMAEPHITVHDEIIQHFAVRIAHMLNNAKMGEAFDRLVLVAPPKMLGEIYMKLDSKICGKITHKVAKELTHYTNEALVKHLVEYI